MIFLAASSYVSLGFEYYANPDARSDGFITWIVDGKPSTRMGAGAVAPDPNGSQVGQRLIPEEPMSIVLNLGISRMFLHASCRSKLTVDSSSKLANHRLDDDDISG